jgi:microcystin-dependent protein
MSTPFIGQIDLFAGNFAPRNYATCQGQLLSISQNTALFSILGTTYGGDGRTTFGLPNLESRAPMHPGRGPGLSTRRLGERGGSATVPLNDAENGVHNHPMLAGIVGTTNVPAATLGIANVSLFAPASSPVPGLDGNALLPQGSGSPHANEQPHLVVTFIIAIQGVYPSRN